jgi:ribosomal protein S12 methylthiotransferase
MKRRYYIEHLGCAKNRADAHVIERHLSSHTWSLVENPDEADVILVNSCGFIQPAKEESIAVLLGAKRDYPDKFVSMCGCFSQRNGEELSKALPEIDGFFGNRDLSKIPEFLEKVLLGSKPVMIPDDPAGPDFWLGAFPRHSGISAYVKLSEGCNHNCRFCAIPLIRGRLRSRPINLVLDEIREALRNGVQEINLIGQDLGYFGIDRGHRELIQLLEGILAIEGHFWLRLLYLHPENLPEGIVDLMKKDSRLVPYIDIPFQHASQSVLREMGRKGSMETYLALIEEFRSDFPDFAIRTSLLLGYPAEKKSDLKQLADFIRKACISWAGFFTYSHEEGTSSYKRYGVLKRMRALARAKKYLPRLQELQEEQTRKYLHRFIGSELELLVEEEVEGENLSLARAYFQAPEVDGAVVLHGRHKPGSFVRAKIIALRGIDLEAREL